CSALEPSLIKVWFILPACLPVDLSPVIGSSPTHGTKMAVSPLDMASESIDDMFDGCRSATASAIDLFGVFEWQVNINFSYAWALVEKKAKKPVHKHLKDDHAVVMYIFTRYASIRQTFNKALKTGKDNYSTGRFRFHYFYYYLTDAVQALSKYPTSCRTVYHRTGERFDQNIVNTNVRFGAFIWASSSKQPSWSYNNISCFEIFTCFGGDITYYSSSKQRGQVLIPTYEVFKVTDIVTNDPWCRVVYKLQSTKTPRTDQNYTSFAHVNPTVKST
uniref:NAD(P)(+)--arginine ADP-ribosyltransferase n=1 Tax=Nothobranchius furzeri TaxID=105023 RepID=A0A8C6NMC3_NOTFU